MNRVRNLNRFQKVNLLLLAAMFAVFSAAYWIAFSRVGFEYNGGILTPEVRAGAVVYTGQIRGTSAAFTVTDDKCVTFQYGDALYGPFTAREDPDALPKDATSSFMTGVELRQGDEIIFRGGVMTSDYPELTLWNEDGSSSEFRVTYSSGGATYDEDGNEIDPMAPSAATILCLMAGPKLTSKGLGEAWLGGVFLSAIAAVLILFADEIFRWNLSLRIRNVQDAEPSEWEMAGRYISWIGLTISALVLYIMGLIV